MNFGDILIWLKAGDRVARTGWNGNGQYLQLVTNWTDGDEIGDTIKVRPFIALCTAQGEFVPWTASQTDILAEDWLVVGYR